MLMLIANDVVAAADNFRYRKENLWHQECYANFDAFNKS